MRKISKLFEKSISSPVSTIATCWHIQLPNKIIGFTTADQKIIHKDVTYNSSAIGRTMISSSITANIDDLEVSCNIDGELIKLSEIKEGLYDMAEFEVFLLDYKLPQSDKLILKRGYIGKLRIEDNLLVLEVYGLRAKLARNVVQLYSPTCRADFCDDFCKLPEEKYTVKGKVTQLKSANIFIDELLSAPTAYYNQGILTFLTGSNKGQKFEVADYSNKQIKLYEPPINAINEGDEYQLRAGCDKEFTTCKEKFNNSKNFRGEPHLYSKIKISR